MAITIKTLIKVCFLNFGYVLEVLGQWPVVTKMSSLKEKTLRQRRSVTAEDLEEWSVNSLADLEVMAKEDKWDGRNLLATPIHRMSETGAIASSEWFLMVGLFWTLLTLLTKPWTWRFFQGTAAPIKIKASVLWGEDTDKDLTFSIDFPRIDVFRWSCKKTNTTASNFIFFTLEAHLIHLDSLTWVHLPYGSRWASSVSLSPRKGRLCPTSKHRNWEWESWWQGKEWLLTNLQIVDCWLWIASTC